MRRDGPDTPSKTLKRLRRTRALLTVAMLLGIFVMLYPVAMRLYSQYVFLSAAESFDQTVGEQPGESMDALWDEAVAYNREHTANTIADPFGDEGPSSGNRYFSLLDPMGNGQMGYMDIPRIGQRLNIYHGTGEKALLEGVGHLEGTSLPVGGQSSHCVLSAHRGLPSAKLFTDLDQMREGDLVFLHILGRTVCYRVDGSQVVEPSEIDALAIVPGEDRLTLVTCTPYAVNTQRLLVHAHRVAYVDPPSLVEEAGMSIRQRFMLQCAGIALAVLAGIAVVLRLVLGGGERRKPVAAAAEPTGRPAGRHFRQ